MPKKLYAIRFDPELIAAVDKRCENRTEWITAAIKTALAPTPSRTGKGARPSTEPAPVKKPVPSIDGYLPCEEHPTEGVVWNPRIEAAVCGQCNCRVKKS